MSPPFKKSIVYLFCDPSQDLYKIGVTKSLYSKRLKQLQTGNGTKLHLVDFFETSFPYDLERYLHKKFFSKKEEGEWFRLDEDDIHSFKESCEYYETSVNALNDNIFLNK